MAKGFVDVIKVTNLLNLSYKEGLVLHYNHIHPLKQRFLRMLEEEVRDLKHRRI